MASADYVFIRRWRPVAAAGLPHSDTPGSKPVDGSPRIVAVFRVLLRLPMPRHPSCARIRLARNFRQKNSLSRYTLQFSLMSNIQFSKIAAALSGERGDIIPHPLLQRKGVFSLFSKTQFAEVNANRAWAFTLASYIVALSPADCRLHLLNAILS